MLWAPYAVYTLADLDLGAYFFDLDPEHFQHIVDHLHGEPLRELDAEEKTEVDSLFDTFHLNDRESLSPIGATSCITSVQNGLSIEMWDEIQRTFSSAAFAAESAKPHIVELLFKETLSSKQESLVRQFAEQQQNMVKIDVGGQIFCSAKETLLRCSDSYFSALFSSGRFQPDHDGL